MNITALCNIYINSESKLHYFQQTFPQVYEISDDWLVYIRGKYRDEVTAFIKKLPNSSSHCTFYSGLDDRQWAKSTQKILKDARYEHVYIYSEDHFLMRSLSQFKAVIKDMLEQKIDYFSYSFFNGGIHAQSTEMLATQESEYFTVFELNEARLQDLKRLNPNFYPFSLVSISSKRYLLALIKIDEQRVIKLPYRLQVFLDIVFGFRAPRNLKALFVVNRFLQYGGIRLTIYTPASPFNLERSLYNFEKHLLPLQIGVLKEELFANADDDNIVPGSCLVKRGLYPRQLLSSEPLATTGDRMKVEHVLPKDEKLEAVYYPDVQRVYTIPQKQITVRKGKIVVSGRGEEHQLAEEESLIINANIPHTLKATVDSVCTTELIF